MRRTIRRFFLFFLLAAAVIGGTVFSFSDRFASARFQLSDRITGIRECAEYTTVTLPTETAAIDDLLADPRTECDSSLLLIRDRFPIPDSFDADAEIVEIRKNVKANRCAAEAFKTLCADVSDRFGTDLLVTADYRTAKQQQTAVDVAGDLAAEVGESEHQAGLALDVCVRGYAGKNLLKSDAGVWLQTECSAYGFIIRYPYYGEKITGIAYEPWHLRYVGQPHAELIAKNRLTLEEYLDSLEPDVFYAYGNFVFSLQSGDEIVCPQAFESCTVSDDNRGNRIVTFRLR